MDTGEDLFARFERYFGVRWTKAMLIIVCLGVVATAVATIVNLIVIPLWKIIRPLVPWPLNGAAIGSAFFVAVQIGAGIAAGSMILDAIQKRRATRELEELLPRAKSIHQEAIDDRAKSREFMDSASDALKRAGATMSASALVLEAVITSARSADFLSPEEINTISGLLDDMAAAMPTDEFFIDMEERAAPEA